MFKTILMTAAAIIMAGTATSASAGSFNGTALNGQLPNGTYPNGQLPNGIYPNGQLPNGVHPNGTSTNAAAFVIDGIELPVRTR